MTDVYFPLFQINPIEVKITNKAGELIYNTGVLSTDDKGDISFNKMFTANIFVITSYSIHYTKLYEWW